ncbi:MAG: pinensin family lanthipeptide [Acidobacteriota bacterium]|nr:pinensin family lanthipeptide [Acidobacteriota bacterium]
MKKMNLDQLEVRSFVTRFENNRDETLKVQGGSLPTNEFNTCVVCGTGNCTLGCSLGEPGCL